MGVLLRIILEDTADCAAGRGDVFALLDPPGDRGDVKALLVGVRRLTCCDPRTVSMPMTPVIVRKLNLPRYPWARARMLLADASCGTEPEID